jgi:outer membrane receptor for Fe3+-dicitrate
LRNAREVRVTFRACSLRVSQNLGMAVPLVHRGIRRQAIEVALALDVIHPDAFRALDDYVEGMIVVSSIFVFEFNEIIGARGFFY